MKKRATEPLDFIIDKLTNSIENVVTGDSFPTVISLLSASDIKNVTKKRGWQFDWRQEWKQPIREVYKLTIPNNPTIIQGLVSLEIRSDHIYMHLVESAPFNKGKPKYMPGYLAILLHLHADCLFREVSKVTCHLRQKLN